MMIKKLVFEEAWISKIMACLSTVSYAVLVNGQPGQVINPTRGLHQGDPISYYLYLICAESLSSLLHKVEASAQIRGIKVARSSPTLIHLFFVDDSIVFYNVTINEWLKV